MSLFWFCLGAGCGSWIGSDADAKQINELQALLKKHNIPVPTEHRRQRLKYLQKGRARQRSIAYTQRLKAEAANKSVVHKALVYAPRGIRRFFR